MTKEYGLLGIVGVVVAVLFCVGLVAVIVFCFIEMILIGIGGVVLAITLPLVALCFWK